MKYDVVIIGGGLSALTCGIRLADAGRKALIVSSGQSTIHFSSGSFDLLGACPGGDEVTNPVEAAGTIKDAAHPYAKLGKSFEGYAVKAAELLGQCGVKVTGSPTRNHFRLSPVGAMCPTWLTLDGMAATEDRQFPFSRIAIVNAVGFLDFYPEFIADSLRDNGVESTLYTFTSDALEALRENPTEMRSANIARTLDSDDTRKALAECISHVDGKCEAILIPAVAGLQTDDTLDAIRTMSGRKNVFTVATMAPSVPGIRLQMRLRKEFERRGGRFMAGDTAVGYDSADGRIRAIHTENHRTEPIEADQFVLATGSFFSSGLAATSTGITEPLFGCDVTFPANRDDWYDENLLEGQPFEKAGVKTDAGFRVQKDGCTIENLYAIGSILEGVDPVEERCREGVDMLTALAVADKIIG